jgi:hypothetical protein
MPAGGSSVPVVVQYNTSVRPAEYDAVISRLRFHDDPPPGLIMHTAAVGDDGCMRIVDVWESRAAHEHFAERRLDPAILAVLGREDGPKTGFEIHDLHSLVKPLGSGHVAVP